MKNQYSPDCYKIFPVFIAPKEESWLKPNSNQCVDFVDSIDSLKRIPNIFHRRMGGIDTFNSTKRIPDMVLKRGVFPQSISKEIPMLPISRNAYGLTLLHLKCTFALTHSDG